MSYTHTAGNYCPCIVLEGAKHVFELAQIEPDRSFQIRNSSQPPRLVIFLGKLAHPKQNVDEVDIDTDRGFGASFDREAGATCGGWTRFRKPGAYNHPARHAVECAE